MARKKRIYETRTIRSKGALFHLFKEEGMNHYKLHSWDGPAIEPIEKGCEEQEKYYLYGYLYTKDEWRERVSQREGLPYYKNPSMKNLLDAYRN